MKPGYIMFLVGLVPSMILEYCYYFIKKLFGFILVVVFHVTN
jgi:hypothetical protein